MLDPGKVKHTLLRTNPKTDLSLALFYNINYAIASPFLVNLNKEESIMEVRNPNSKLVCKIDERLGIVEGADRKCVTKSTLCVGSEVAIQTRDYLTIVKCTSENSYSITHCSMETVA